MQLLGHTPHTFPLIVVGGLQWKGGGVGPTAQAVYGQMTLMWTYPPTGFGSELIEGAMLRS